MSENNTEDIQLYLNMLERLRKEPFNQTTNKALASHPYLVAAKEGTLTMAQRRAFVGEQYAIQYSDACSFAKLTGHDHFHPATLLTASVPKPPTTTTTTTTIGTNKVGNNNNHDDDLFQFLLGGEVYASKLLLVHAQSVGFDTEEAIQGYPITARAQAYPSYWARLALTKQRGAGAAACAVNFPAWGNMCAEIALALKTRPEYGYSFSIDGDEDRQSSLAFIDFFATPIDNLDTMAATIMMQERTTYEDLVTVVRLLQQYEVMFWDAIYDAR
ncbi:TENA/THI-4/PQQC family protein [Nitzschia inconspicua]|uniref:TENA/THI-4/PQQC family protein n=1 Tax=Nitzschia inconspicua TaxID=303405 RepID=A0A9K3Q4X8_9STRA|nr:TENA/THI-4/PQQC family protein [Nitzschia inconspicua]